MGMQDTALVPARQSGLGPEVRVPGGGDMQWGVSMKISAVLIQL